MAIITKKLDLSKPTGLSEKAKKRIDSIEDENIDYSDIPELTEEFFARAKKASEFQKSKTRISIRIDDDILDWLKESGKGYQTRANMILRAAMETDG
jgi:uncharacterized protein (DUF4415 family)